MAMAVSEETLPVGRSLRVPRPGRLFVAFVVAVVLGAAAVAGGLVAFHESLAGRILPGVSAAGVDLGGLTPDQARAALTERYHGLGDGGVVIRAGVATTTIAFADAGRGADVEAMVTAAGAVGRGGTWFDETIAAIRIRLEPQAIPLALSYDRGRAANAVHTFVEAMATQPADASTINTTLGFATVPAIDGSRIDEPAAVAAVDAAMVDV